MNLTISLSFILSKLHSGYFLWDKGTKGEFKATMMTNEYKTYIFAKNLFRT